MSTQFTINGVTYTWPDDFDQYKYLSAWPAMILDSLADFTGKMTTAGQYAAAAGGAGWSTRYAFDTSTTDSDPGAGNVRLNNAAPASATAVYIDLADAGGADVTAALDALDDSTSTVKGFLSLRHRTDPTKWALYALTGLTTATGYRKLAVTYVSGPGGFVASDPVAVAFARTGDKGDTGATGATGDNKLCEGGTAGGTANALTCTASPAFTGARGECVSLLTGAAANSGSATLTASGVTQTIRKNGSALTGGELPASTRVLMQSDGTYLELVSGGGAGTIWSTVTADTTLLSNTGVICNGASPISVTLPTSPVAGSRFSVAGLGAGGWKVVPGSGTTLHDGNASISSSQSLSGSQYASVDILALSSSVLSVLSKNGPSDDFWGYVTALFHFDNALTDATGTVSLTNVNGTYSNSVYKFGGYSLSLNGSNAYVYAASPGNAAKMAGAFTLEAWIYPTSFNASYSAIFDCRASSGSANGFIFDLHPDGKLTLYSTAETKSSGAPTLNAWNHVALTRDAAGLMTFWLNGIGVGTLTNTSNFSDGAFYIGRQATGSDSFFPGYIDDFRLTNGYCRYTANFTPSATAFPY